MNLLQTMETKNSSIELTSSGASLPVEMGSVYGDSISHKEQQAVPILLVKSGDKSFAVPQENLLELVRLDKGGTKTGMEMIKGSPVYRLRGNLLPLVSLHEILEIGGYQKGEQEKIVVLQAGECRFGLLVSEIINSEQIIEQPLPHCLKETRVYTGTTILDEKVILILDVLGLANKAHAIKENFTHEDAEKPDSHSKESKDDLQTLLIIGIGKEGRMAIPLSQVARLEKVRRSSVEKSGALDVVQYRDSIMPLIYLSKSLGVGASKSNKDMMDIVVFSHRSKNAGLVVDHIFDIASETLSKQRSLNRKNVFATTVIQGQVTDLIDVEKTICEVDPGFFQGTTDSGVIKGDKS